MCSLSARRCEEVDAVNLLEAPLEADELALGLPNLAVIEHAGAEPGFQLTSLLCNCRKVSVTRRTKEILDIDIPEPIDEASFHEGCLAARGADLAQHPLEIFLGCVGARQHVDGVLQCYRADARQAATNFHSQVVGLRGDLMNEQEPPPC